MIDIAGKVKKLRIERGFSQREVAEKLGIRQPNYGKIENGETPITVEKLEVLAEVFDVKISNFFDQESNSYIQKLKNSLYGFYRVLDRLNICVINTSHIGNSKIKLSDLDKEWKKGSPNAANLNPFSESDFKEYHRKFPEGFGLTKESIKEALNELTYNYQDYLYRFMDEESD